MRVPFNTLNLNKLDKEVTPRDGNANLPERSLRVVSYYYLPPELPVNQPHCRRVGRIDNLAVGIVVPSLVQKIYFIITVAVILKLILWPSSRSGTSACNDGLGIDSPPGLL